MLSKNNTSLYQKQHRDQRQRFGLRKLSVGVASVLLGTTFLIGGVQLPKLLVKTLLKELRQSKSKRQTGSLTLTKL
ncbi:YSIRK-type signal peptide-containing protein [Limosilactobacillus sp.]|jgi:hypothetical protein|uniref:YSIRK-type signal peptide-containing protein n=1 Tax=Limosilactobacillus sp. TaxID=2773925 RepID=UPI0025C24236|nr:YSIRK-type signal peptide-containing protein [Limosilactobacillus sp.]MCH3921347.1 YSIRK-type signal peptide-containing protein [Limosilactobacillus sp.]MCH3928118.1 YSIRK-type signal peptide-containing protein [Limosilactobacillus sp.]